MSDWEDTTRVEEVPLPGEDLAPERDRAYVMVLAGANIGEMYRIDGSELVLGRSPDAHVRLVDDGISREHCRILLEGGEIWVEDLGSSNGTFHNGRRLTRERLRDGDKLRLGQTTVLKI